MPFHRFKDPTYFESTGSFPGTIDGTTYDRINVISEGVGAGGSAIVDGPIVAGNNIGSLFTGFSEDGRSASVNRGLKALAEGADHLDDLIHSDLATPTIRAPVTPGAPVSSFVITDDVFVGTGADTQNNRSGLIQLVDINGEPLNVLVAGVFTAVKVTSITGIGGGYQTNPTIGVSPSIPAGIQYRAVYYKRKSLASQAQDVLTDLAKVNGNWEPDLWALARNIATQDFAFGGVKTFNEQVIVDSDTAAMLTSTEASEDFVGDRRLVFQHQMNTTGTAIYSRWYVDRFSTQHFLVTHNARWDHGTSMWVADDSTAEKSLFTVGQGIAIRRVAIGPATWANGDWIEGIAIIPGQTAAGEDPINYIADGTSANSGAKTTRARVTVVDVLQLVSVPISTGELGWAHAGGGPAAGMIRTTIVSVSVDKAYLVLRMPDGATWNSTRVKFISTGGTITFQLYKAELRLGTPTGAPIATAVSAATTPAGAGTPLVVVIPVTVPETIDNSDFVYYLEVDSSTSLDTILGCWADWDDPGPRNF